MSFIDWLISSPLSSALAGFLLASLVFAVLFWFWIPSDDCPRHCRCRKCRLEKRTREGSSLHSIIPNSILRSSLSKKDRWEDCGVDPASCRIYPPSQAQYLDERSMLTERDDRSTLSHRHDRSTLSHRDDRSMLSHRDDRSTLLPRDERGTLLRPDERSTLLHIDDRNTLLSRDERSTLPHRDDRSTLLHRDDRSTLLHRDERGTLPPPDERSTLLHRDDRSTLLHRDERGTLPPLDERSTLPHRDDRSTLLHRDERGALPYPDERSTRSYRCDRSTLSHQDDRGFLPQRDDRSILSQRDDGSAHSSRDYVKSTHSQRDGGNIQSEPDERSTYYSQRDERSTYYCQRDERSTLPHPDERTTFPHPDERTTLPHPDERTTLPHPDDRTTLPHYERMTLPHPDDRTTLPQPVERTTLPHPDERRTLPHPDERTTLPHPDERRTLPHPDERRTLPYPDERMALPHPDERKTLPYPDERRTLPYPDERKTLPYPDERRTLPHPDERTTIPYPDERRTVHQPDERSRFYSQQDERNTLPPPDEKSTLPHLDERSTFSSQRDERSTLPHRDERSTFSSQRDERSTLPHRDERSTFSSQRDERSTLPHRDERSTSQRDERSTLPHPDARSTYYSQRDERSTLPHPDERSRYYSQRDGRSTLSHRGTMSTLPRREERSLHSHRDEWSILSQRVDTSTFPQQDDPSKHCQQDVRSTHSPRDVKSTHSHRSGKSARFEPDEKSTLSERDDRSVHSRYDEEDVSFSGRYISDESSVGRHSAHRNRSSAKHDLWQSELSLASDRRETLNTYRYGSTRPRYSQPPSCDAGVKSPAGCVSHRSFKRDSNCLPLADEHCSTFQESGTWGLDETPQRRSMAMGRYGPASVSSTVSRKRKRSRSLSRESNEREPACSTNTKARHSKDPDLWKPFSKESLPCTPGRCKSCRPYTRDKRTSRGSQPSCKGSRPYSSSNISHHSCVLKDKCEIDSKPLLDCRKVTKARPKCKKSKPPSCRTTSSGPCTRRSTPSCHTSVRSPVRFDSSCTIQRTSSSTSASCSVQDEDSLITKSCHSLCDDDCNSWSPTTPRPQKERSVRNKHSTVSPRGSAKKKSGQNHWVCKMHVPLRGPPSPWRRPNNARRSPEIYLCTSLNTGDCPPPTLDTADESQYGEGCIPHLRERPGVKEIVITAQRSGFKVKRTEASTGNKNRPRKSARDQFGDSTNALQQDSPGAHSTEFDTSSFCHRDSNVKQSESQQRIKFRQCSAARDIRLNCPTFSLRGMSQDQILRNINLFGSPDVTADTGTTPGLGGAIKTSHHERKHKMFSLNDCANELKSLIKSTISDMQKYDHTVSPDITIGTQKTGVPFSKGQCQTDNGRDTVAKTTVEEKLNTYSQDRISPHHKQNHHTDQTNRASDTKNEQDSQKQINRKSKTAANKNYILDPNQMVKTCKKRHSAREAMGQQAMNICEEIIKDALPKHDRKSEDDTKVPEPCPLAGNTSCVKELFREIDHISDKNTGGLFSSQGQSVLSTRTDQGVHVQNKPDMKFARTHDSIFVVERNPHQHRPCQTRKKPVATDEKKQSSIYFETSKFGRKPDTPAQEKDGTMNTTAQDNNSAPSSGTYNIVSPISQGNQPIVTCGNLHLAPHKIKTNKRGTTSGKGNQYQNYLYNQKNIQDLVPKKHGVLTSNALKRGNDIKSNSKKGNVFIETPTASEYLRRDVLAERKTHPAVDKGGLSERNMVPNYEVSREPHNTTFPLCQLLLEQQEAFNTEPDHDPRRRNLSLHGHKVTTTDTKRAGLPDFEPDISCRDHCISKAESSKYTNLSHENVRQHRPRYNKSLLSLLKKEARKNKRYHNRKGNRTSSGNKANAAHYGKRSHSLHRGLRLPEKCMMHQEAIKLFGKVLLESISDSLHVSDHDTKRHKKRTGKKLKLPDKCKNIFRDKRTKGKNNNLNEMRTDYSSKTSVAVSSNLNSQIESVHSLFEYLLRHQAQEDELSSGVRPDDQSSLFLESRTSHSSCTYSSVSCRPVTFFHNSRLSLESDGRHDTCQTQCCDSLSLAFASSNEIQLAKITQRFKSSGLKRSHCQDHVEPRQDEAKTRFSLGSLAKHSEKHPDQCNCQHIANTFDALNSPFNFSNSSAKKVRLWTNSSLTQGLRQCITSSFSHSTSGKEILFCNTPKKSKTTFPNSSSTLKSSDTFYLPGYLKHLISNFYDSESKSDFSGMKKRPESPVSNLRTNIYSHSGKNSLPNFNQRSPVSYGTDSGSTGREVKSWTLSFSENSDDYSNAFQERRISHAGNRTYTDDGTEVQRNQVEKHSTWQKRVSLQGSPPSVIFDSEQISYMKIVPKNDIFKGLRLSHLRKARFPRPDKVKRQKHKLPSDKAFYYFCSSTSSLSASSSACQTVYTVITTSSSPVVGGGRELRLRKGRNIYVPRVPRSTSRTSLSSSILPDYMHIKHSHVLPDNVTLPKKAKIRILETSMPTDMTEKSRNISHESPIKQPKLHFKWDHMHFIPGIQMDSTRPLKRKEKSRPQVPATFRTKPAYVDPRVSNIAMSPQSLAMTPVVPPEQVGDDPVTCPKQQTFLPKNEPCRHISAVYQQRDEKISCHMDDLVKQTKEKQGMQMDKQISCHFNDSVKQTKDVTDKQISCHFNDSVKQAKEKQGMQMDKQISCHFNDSVKQTKDVTDKQISCHVDDSVEITQAIGKEPHYCLVSFDGSGEGVAENVLSREKHDHNASPNPVFAEHASACVENTTSDVHSDLFNGMPVDTEVNRMHAGNAKGLTSEKKVKTRQRRFGERKEDPRKAMQGTFQTPREEPCLLQDSPEIRKQKATDKHVNQTVSQTDSTVERRNMYKTLGRKGNNMCEEDRETSKRRMNKYVDMYSGAAETEPPYDENSLEKKDCRAVRNGPTQRKKTPNIELIEKYRMNEADMGKRATNQTKSGKRTQIKVDCQTHNKTGGQNVFKAVQRNITQPGREIQTTQNFGPDIEHYRYRTSRYVSRDGGDTGLYTKHLSLGQNETADEQQKLTEINLSSKTPGHKETMKETDYGNRRQGPPTQKNLWNSEKKMQFEPYLGNDHRDEGELTSEDTNETQSYPMEETVPVSSKYRSKRRTKDTFSANNENQVGRFETFGKVPVAPEVEKTHFKAPERKYESPECRARRESSKPFNGGMSWRAGHEHRAQRAGRYEEFYSDYKHTGRQFMFDKGQEAVADEVLVCDRSWEQYCTTKGNPMEDNKRRRGRIVNSTYGHEKDDSRCEVRAKPGNGLESEGTTVSSDNGNHELEIPNVMWYEELHGEETDGGQQRSHNNQYRDENEQRNTTILKQPGGKKKEIGKELRYKRLHADKTEGGRHSGVRPTSDSDEYWMEQRLHDYIQDNDLESGTKSFSEDLEKNKDIETKQGKRVIPNRPSMSGDLNTDQDGTKEDKLDRRDETRHHTRKNKVEDMSKPLSKGWRLEPGYCDRDSLARDVIRHGTYRVRKDMPQSHGRDKKNCAREAAPMVNRGMEQNSERGYKNDIVRDIFAMIKIEHEGPRHDALQKRHDQPMCREAEVNATTKTNEQLKQRIQKKWMEHAIEKSSEALPKGQEEHLAVASFDTVKANQEEPGLKRDRRGHDDFLCSCKLKQDVFFREMGTQCAREKDTINQETEGDNSQVPATTVGEKHGRRTSSNETWIKFDFHDLIEALQIIQNPHGERDNKSFNIPTVEMSKRDPNWADNHVKESDTGNKKLAATQTDKRGLRSTAMARNTFNIKPREILTGWLNSKKQILPASSNTEPTVRKEMQKLAEKVSTPKYQSSVLKDKTGNLPFASTHNREIVFNGTQGSAHQKASTWNAINADHMNHLISSGNHFTNKHNDYLEQPETITNNMVHGIRHDTSSYCSDDCYSLSANEIQTKHPDEQVVPKTCGNVPARSQHLSTQPPVKMTSLGRRTPALRGALAKHSQRLHCSPRTVKNLKFKSKIPVRMEPRRSIVSLTGRRSRLPRPRKSTPAAPALKSTIPKQGKQNSTALSKPVAPRNVRRKHTDMGNNISPNCHSQHCGPFNPMMACTGECVIIGVPPLQMSPNNSRQPSKHLGAADRSLHLGINLIKSNVADLQDPTLHSYRSKTTLHKSGSNSRSRGLQQLKSPKRSSLKMEENRQSQHDIESMINIKNAKSIVVRSPQGYVIKYNMNEAQPSKQTAGTRPKLQTAERATCKARTNCLSKQNLDTITEMTNAITAPLTSPSSRISSRIKAKSSKILEKGEKECKGSILRLNSSLKSANSLTPMNLRLSDQHKNVQFESDLKRNVIGGTRIEKKTHMPPIFPHRESICAADEEGNVGKGPLSRESKQRKRERFHDMIKNLPYPVYRPCTISSQSFIKETGGTKFSANNKVDNLKLRINNGQKYIHGSYKERITTSVKVATNSKRVKGPPILRTSLRPRARASKCGKDFSKWIESVQNSTNVRHTVLKKKSKLWAKHGPDIKVTSLEALSSRTTNEKWKEPEEQRAVTKKHNIETKGENHPKLNLSKTIVWPWDSPVQKGQHTAQDACFHNDQCHYIFKDRSLQSRPVVSDESFGRLDLMELVHTDEASPLLKHCPLVKNMSFRIPSFQPPSPPPPPPTPPRAAVVDSARCPSTGSCVITSLSTLHLDTSDDVSASVIFGNTSSPYALKESIS